MVYMFMRESPHRKRVFLLSHYNHFSDERLCHSKTSFLLLSNIKSPSCQKMWPCFIGEKKGDFQAFLSHDRKRKKKLSWGFLTEKKNLYKFEILKQKTAMGCVLRIYIHFSHIGERDDLSSIWERESEYYGDLFWPHSKQGRNKLWAKKRLDQVRSFEMFLFDQQTHH